jgi:hypothetical protein
MFVANTLMRSLDDRIALAVATMTFCRALGKRRARISEDAA